MTQTTPLGGEIFASAVGFAVVDPLAKFHSRNIQGGLNFRKRLRDPDHTRFGGFSPSVGFSIVDAFAKFKKHSFINSRND